MYLSNTDLCAFLSFTIPFFPMKALPTSNCGLIKVINF